MADEIENERYKVLLAWLRDTYCQGNTAELARRIGKDKTYVPRLFLDQSSPHLKRIGPAIMKACKEAFDLPAGFWDWSVTDGLVDVPADFGKHAVPTVHQDTNVAPAPTLTMSTWLPVVGHVRAGPDGYLEEMQYPVGHGDGYVEYWTKDQLAYALRIKGDSMHPRYRAGEFIVVTPSIEPQPGRDVVVKLKSGQSLLKQLNWIRDGEIQLLSINNGYAPHTISMQDVESIQRVAGSVAPDAFTNERPGYAKHF